MDYCENCGREIVFEQSPFEQKITCHCGKIYNIKPYLGSKTIIHQEKPSFSYYILNFVTFSFVISLIPTFTIIAVIAKSIANIQIIAQTEVIAILISLFVVIILSLLYALFLLLKSRNAHLIISSSKILLYYGIFKKKVRSIDIADILQIKVSDSKIPFLRFIRRKMFFIADNNRIKINFPLETDYVIATVKELNPRIKVEIPKEQVQNNK